MEGGRRKGKGKKGKGKERKGEKKGREGRGGWGMEGGRTEEKRGREGRRKKGKGKGPDGKGRERGKGGKEKGREEDGTERKDIGYLMERKRNLLFELGKTSRNPKFPNSRFTCDPNKRRKSFGAHLLRWGVTIRRMKCEGNETVKF